MLRFRGSDCRRSLGSTWYDRMGTIDYGLKYDVNQKINLEVYVDLDWTGSSIDRKSTSGC